jgi:putative transposase
MGRQPRFFVPGLPHHIVQRGHDRNAVFVEHRDYEYYLANLVKLSSHYDIGVHAYCLMTNHVHLILVPHAKGIDISKLMKRLSARQGRRVNRLEDRIGTIWSGRFKSSVIETDRYLMACLRYVELNPVRAGIVSTPEEYSWSSYRQRLGICSDHWIEDDVVTAMLGNNLAEIRCAYAKFVQAGTPRDELARIRNSVRRNQLTGGDTFIDEIEKRTGVRVETRGRGRPGK